MRYDAFRDIGGEQSASIALLDNTASGLVISMIHSRDYARIYVKQLRHSVPDRALSPEEVEVVEAALKAGGRHDRRRRTGGRHAQAGGGAPAGGRSRARPAPRRRRRAAAPQISKRRRSAQRRRSSHRRRNNVARPRPWESE